MQPVGQEVDVRERRLQCHGRDRSGVALAQRACEPPPDGGIAPESGDEHDRNAAAAPPRTSHEKPHQGLQHAEGENLRRRLACIETQRRPPADAILRSPRRAVAPCERERENDHERAHDDHPRERAQEQRRPADPCGGKQLRAQRSEQRALQRNEQQQNEGEHHGSNSTFPLLCRLSR